MHINTYAMLQDVTNYIGTENWGPGRFVQISAFGHCVLVCTLHPGISGLLRPWMRGAPKKPFPSEPLITLQYETSLYQVWVQTTFDICCQT